MGGMAGMNMAGMDGMKGMDMPANWEKTIQQEQTERRWREWTWGIRLKSCHAGHEQP